MASRVSACEGIRLCLVDWEEKLNVIETPADGERRLKLPTQYSVGISPNSFKIFFLIYFLIRTVVGSKSSNLELRRQFFLKRCRKRSGS